MFLHVRILNISRMTNLLSHGLIGRESNVMPSHAENWFLCQPIPVSNPARGSVQSCTHFLVTLYSGSICEQKRQIYHIFYFCFLHL